MYTGHRASTKDWVNKVWAVVTSWSIRVLRAVRMVRRNVSAARKVRRARREEQALPISASSFRFQNAPGNDGGAIVHRQDMRYI